MRVGLTRANKNLADDNKTIRKAVPISGTDDNHKCREYIVQKNVIAVVDDDAGIRYALGGLLTSWGYVVELYGSAEDFVRASISSAAACLLVDIQLGDVSGVELGRHLASCGFTFPIVFMTGSQDETFRRQALDLGCVAYLLKPLGAQQLKQAIDLAIEQNDRE
jgi:FixJ family two-component response regulator